MPQGKSKFLPKISHSFNEGGIFLRSLLYSLSKNTSHYFYIDGIRRCQNKAGKKDNNEYAVVHNSGINCRLYPQIITYNEMHIQKNTEVDFSLEYQTDFILKVIYFFNFLIFGCLVRNSQTIQVIGISYKTETDPHLLGHCCCGTEQ